MVSFKDGQKIRSLAPGRDQTKGGTPHRVCLCFGVCAWLLACDSSSSLCVSNLVWRNDAGPSAAKVAADSSWAPRRASSALGSARQLPTLRHHPRRTLSDEGDDLGFTDAPYYSFRPRDRRRLLPRLNPRNIRAGRLCGNVTISIYCPKPRVRHKT